ncbi:MULTISPECIES: hypothetical protein [Bacillus]|uniref:Cytoskeletal protein CcmA (Bactofilin family) n=1 Tax=Bacillus amyloliquefaciens (strain ATCC 23350 / DSM 7 / BCRC 11601 / CCUG 28519 / NBRC 15535 / NRRL B-14393 / F) TaxID=692420 RepID=A0A9P1JFM4_BACAS|nr:hypothetical protein [Bacillus amyloliquefaciens]AIW32890.1 hypothetical protein KS08_04315 [Bacillus subtilis]AEB23016.1 hypothetical protein BAMTA208_04175 [Bacillus amyloliquefaciens TA208]AEB62518.1 hypothetical protein LL3_00976 [Bacillus amyloliquefaciens LL3]AEK88013.1 hypothetical protein BAXH7_00871 [Bacillus amyloliquefaciens XH7]ARW38145.1 uncharacterized protein S101267_01056 [Bacillus amyloliquefaciens]
METTKKLSHLKMYGAGHAAGGSYQNVSIKGEGTVGEGLRSERCRIFGTGRFLGDAETNRLKIFGEHEVEGDLSARSANVIGTLKIGGSMRFTRMRLKGLADISGSAAGEQCHIKGSLTVSGDCETEQLHVTGCINVAGLLNAGDVNIHLRYDQSKVKEIGGTSITVRRKPGLLKRKAGMLSAELIEGDTVYLEYTKADIVRGKHVEIGPGCKIGKIEYRTSCKTHEKSTVQEHIQI